MNKAKRILFYSPYGQWYLHTLYDITLAHALEIRGAEVKLIGCDGLFTDCDVHWENTSPRTSRSCAVCQKTQETVCGQLAMPVDWLGKFLPEGAEQKARTWVDGLEDDALMKAAYQNVPLGEWVESSVHSHFRMRDLDLTDSKISTAYRSYLYSAVLAYEGLTRVFESFKPDVLFMLNGRFFSHRVAFELARKQGVRVYNHERGRTDNSLRIFENETALTFNTLQKSWEAWRNQPLTETELNETEKVFAERSKGVNTGWKSFVKAGEQEVNVLMQQIGLNPEQKLITLFTSSDDEAGVSKAWKPVIIDQFEWIRRTVNYFRNKPDYKLVIRVHPNIAGITGINAQFLNRIKGLLPDLPENVHIVMPADAVNSYQLIALSQSVLVYFSSLGLEAPFMGKPTLICSKGLFYDKGFALTLKEESEYEAMLQKLLQTSFSTDFLRAAYRYGYHYFIRQNLPFPKVSVINVHDAKINYESDEDLLPGKDLYLDRLCESVLTGRPVIPLPKEKRSAREESDILNERLSQLAQMWKEQAKRKKQNNTQSSPARKPLVSVIIPCYNYANYLPEAVKSVVNQTFRDFEIIIVNDGSTDNSKEVALELIQKYKNVAIQLLDQPNSGQPAISRNNGIKRSKGKYIVPLDADDKLAPRALELFYNALQPLADQPCVAHGTIQYFGTEDGFWHAKKFNPHHLLRRGHVPSCSMFHRSVWELQDGYRLNVPGYEDWDFWIGALENGAEFVPVSEVVMYYRKTEKDSLIDKAVVKHEWYIAKIIKNHPHLYEEIENEWADYYMDLHPDVPQSREIHGPDDRFPRVTAFLVDTYPEHYSQQEIIWAKEYLERHPFLVKKKIEEITMNLERETADGSPAELFDSAWEFLNAGYFRRAVQKIIAYRHTVVYDTFSRQDKRIAKEPLLSVVIVAYHTGELLLECLQALDSQKDKNFEVIVVDNGGNESVEETLKQKNILYIKAPTNVYLSEGRNIGAHFARGKYLAFLDDDAVVPDDYTASILKAFKVYDVVALRGKVVPKSKNKRNKKAGHYDLGNLSFPHTIDAEGNSAFVKEVFLNYGGMDPLLFGHEGSEWSYRYFVKEKQYKLVYWPETVIYHDYAFSESKLDAKEKRHRIMWDYLNYKHNNMSEWLSIYNRFEETGNHRKTGNSLLQKQETTEETESGSPLISICIITYNREHYLKDALNSALSQQEVSFEVVVVDDGSTDQTAQLVRSMNDSRIRYIFKEHTNAPDTRNRAIAEARGTYILWLDSDDYLQENILTTYKEYIDVFPEVDLFYGFLYVVDEDKNLSKEITYQDWYRKNDALREQLVFSNQLPNPGMLVKKEGYASVGTYNPEFIRAHDYEWFSRAVDSLKFKSITQHVCFYRAHSKSLSPEYGNADKQYEAKISDTILQKYPLKKLVASLNWRKEPENVLRTKIYMLAVEHMFKLRQPVFAEKYYRLAANEHSGIDVKTVYLEMKEQYLQGKTDVKNKPVLRTEKETGLTVTAIISAYNEGDVIYHVIGDLVQQNIQVYLIDHHSTDNTVAEASKWLGLGLIKIETFPEESGYQIPDQTYSWRFILKRKEDIAKQLGHGWYIHADADEFRESPWKELNLRQGIERVDREGYNAINFLIYDFKPTDNQFEPGADVRNYLKYYSSPKLAYDEVQLKCWKYEGQDFNLWETGGHEVRFEQRKIYPVPFILRHYPIRSQAHGLNKIFNERKNRWDEEERKAKWHAQYDHIQSTEYNFLHDPKTLKKYEREVVCREILQAFDTENNTKMDETKPLVSIIFLTFNALKYTKLAVQSVLEHTQYPYELIIVDNHSTDGTRNYLLELSKQHPHIKAIFNKKNKGFAAGNNQGVRKAKGKYVLVLNNDVLVADGWLSALVDALEKDPAIGMVGPITNHISGLQRVTGVPYNDVSGFPAFAAQVAKVNKNKITPRRRIAGFAMLMERHLYQDLKGFDESFGIGNYEDDDLCLRVREKGLAIMVHEGVYLHHFGSQTFKANKMDYSASLDEKGKRFKEKWPNINYQELLELENPLSVYIGEQLSEAQDAMEQGDFEQALDALQRILKENPIHSSALFLAAVAESQLQHYDKALVCLNKLVGLEPDNALVYNQIGLNFKAQGDLDSAQKAFLKAIESDPGLVDAQRNFGDVLIEAGDFENGVQTFVTILKNHPNDIPALLYMSQIHLDAGKWQSAQTYVQKALELDPENTLAEQLLELIRQENGTENQPKQTSASLQPAMEALLKGQYEKAARAFEMLLETDPHDEEALYGLVLCRMGLKEFDRALNVLDTLNRLHPDSPEVFNQIGLALMAKNEWDASETAFKHAMELNPDFIDAQRNYGDWLIRRERYEEGIIKFQEIILNHPDDVPALLYLAQLNYETGRLEDAAIYVNKAVSVQPENPIALQLKALIEQEDRFANREAGAGEESIARANTLLEQGEVEQAQALYKEVLEKESENISARFGLGLCALSQNELQASAGYFKTIVEQEPDFVPAYNQLGTIALIQQQYQQAVEYFSQSLEQNNDQIHICNLLADALIFNGDYQQGVQLLVNSAETYPENTETLFKLGEIYMELDRQKEAKILFRRILQIDPQHQDAQKNLDKMVKN